LIHEANEMEEGNHSEEHTGYDQIHARTHVLASSRAAGTVSAPATMLADDRPPHVRRLDLRVHLRDPELPMPKRSLDHAQVPDPLP
jgi:hypothetical protein